MSHSDDLDLNGKPRRHTKVNVKVDPPRPLYERFSEIIGERKQGIQPNIIEIEIPSSRFNLCGVQIHIQEMAELSIKSSPDERRVYIKPTEISVSGWTLIIDMDEIPFLVSALTRRYEKVKGR